MAREGINLIQQIAVQTVLGTAVPVTKRFSNIAIDLGFELTTKQFRSHGAKATTTSIIHKAMSQGSYEGPLSYNEIIYPLASQCAFVTAAPNTDGGSLWTFTAAPAGNDTFKVFTLEQADDEANEKYADLLFTSLDIAWGLEDVMMSGNAFAGARTLTDPGTPTPGTTQIAERPVSARDISIKLSPTYSATQVGYTLLTDAFDAKLSLGEKWLPKWVLNKLMTTFKEPYEKISDKTFTLTIEANAQGRALLLDLMNPTSATPGRYFYVEAVGPKIGLAASTTFNKITAEFYARLTQVREIKDYQESLFAYEMSFVLLQDPVMISPYILTVMNALPTL